MLAVTLGRSNDKMSLPAVQTGGVLRLTPYPEGSAGSDQNQTQKKGILMDCEARRLALELAVKINQDKETTAESVLRDARLFEKFLNDEAMDIAKSS